MLSAAAAVPERSAAAGASHHVDAGLCGVNRTSFIRVQLCDRKTIIFMPFVPNVDTGATLKGSVAQLIGAPSVSLFELKQLQKHPLEDGLTLTVQNTDACSLWFCCAPDALDALNVNELLARK
jgi:hypothetical protein